MGGTTSHQYVHRYSTLSSTEEGDWCSAIPAAYAKVKSRRHCNDINSLYTECIEGFVSMANTWLNPFNL